MKVGVSVVRGASGRGGGLLDGQTWGSGVERTTFRGLSQGRVGDEGGVVSGRKWGVDEERTRFPPEVKETELSRSEAALGLWPSRSSGGGGGVGQGPPSWS